MSGRDVSISEGVPGYAATPPGAERGVVVIHEIFGRQPEIDRVVERFAARGYAAVAPDLFHGKGKVTCLRQSIWAMRSGEGPLVEAITAARGWLARSCGVAEARIGVIGFCLGGGFALAVGRQFRAVSTNYGDVPPDEVLRGIGPTIGCYGRRDRLFGKNGPELERRLGALGVEVETHTYESVGHAFLTDGHHPVARVLMRPVYELRYDPAVADEAWQKIFAFLDRQL